MTSQVTVRKRRREMAALCLRGMAPYRAAEKLATKYDVKEQTVRQDWSKRDEWITDVFDFGDGDTAVKDLIVSQKEVKRELWHLYRQSNNANVKLGILKEIGSINKDLLGMMEGSGIVREEDVQTGRRTTKIFKVDTSGFPEPKQELEEVQ